LEKIEKEKEELKKMRHMIVLLIFKMMERRGLFAELRRLMGMMRKKTLKIMKTCF
jgi:hypothetical protein